MEFQYIVLIIAVVIWMISKKSKSAYYCPDIKMLNVINRDNTMLVLEGVRKKLNVPLWNLDVFDTDGNSFVFTNLGLIINGGREDVSLVAYGVIKHISDPEIAKDNKGKLLKAIRMVTIETTYGKTIVFTYLNRKNNNFEKLFDNIRKTGYPMPSYEGAREITIKEEEKPEQIFDGGNDALYEGH